MMIIREAINDDISRMQIVRNSVKENILSNPALVTDEHCKDYISNRGKGWVCEVNGTITGFAIADLVDNNIWALFIHPNYERKGIGRKLHNEMMNWYFAQQKEFVWLSTEPYSRAADFYAKAGWKQTGTTKSGEIKFEMTAAEWKTLQLSSLA